MFSVLPPQEHTFTIDVQGSRSGQQFHGSFTYARPTLGMNLEIGKTKAFLTGGLNVDQDTDAVADMLATLRHTMVKYPDWWKEAGYGAKLLDLNVVFVIMQKCNDYEKTFADKMVASAEVKKDEQARPA